MLSRYMITLSCMSRVDIVLISDLIPSVSIIFSSVKENR